MTFTWKQAAEIAKQLQIKYQLPIFAITFKDSCSCCAEPSNLNNEAYLTLDVKDKSCNSSGKANMNDEFSVTSDGLFDEKRHRTQYIKYKLSKSFSQDKLKECLTEFINKVNEDSFTTYKLSVPEDAGLCATIEKI